MSQPLGCASKEVAINTPPPDGFELEDKRILFVAFEPDNEVLSVYPLPQEEIMIDEEERMKDE